MAEKITYAHQEVIPITECQACESPDLTQIINFGPNPKPNIYRTWQQVMRDGQITYQLDSYLCIRCGLVQLGEHVASDELFADDYAFRTHEAMRRNFKEGAFETVLRANIEPGAKVLEIGSNVGICLSEYQKLGMKVLGVDPATLYAKQANEAGIETIIAPFTPDLANDILNERGPMDVVTAANVLQHIPDIKGTLEGVRRVLAKDGLFTLEFPYLGDILRNTDFDTFYAEHYYYLSLIPLQKIFDGLGMTLVHAKHLPDIHCGSMRIFAKHAPAEMTPELKMMIQEEKNQGLTDPQRYLEFKAQVNNIMHDIHQHLHVAQTRGERVVAHGASAKFVTLTNYGHIGPDQIRYVADSTKAKHGKVTPGMGIPVEPEEKLFSDNPDIIFNGIRNYYNFNKDKYEAIKRNNPNAKVLIPIPHVHYK